MHEIKCPHCGKAFKIDEAGYADILKQVRDGDFEQQLHERLDAGVEADEVGVDLGLVRGDGREFAEEGECAASRRRSRNAGRTKPAPDPKRIYRH